MKLIPKYQNEGLVTRQDNTYVAKPTIPPKLIKGGFDNIPATVNGKTKFRVGRNAWDYRSPSQFYNVHYYDREPQQYLDNMVQDMHVVNDENPADLLYKVAKDTDAQQALVTYT